MSFLFPKPIYDPLSPPKLVHNLGEVDVLRRNIDFIYLLVERAQHLRDRADGSELFEAPGISHLRTRLTEWLAPSLPHSAEFAADRAVACGTSLAALECASKWYRSGSSERHHAAATLVTGSVLTGCGGDPSIFDSYRFRYGVQASYYVYRTEAMSVDHIMGVTNRTQPPRATLDSFSTLELADALD